jgi:hypothetical protein
VNGNIGAPFKQSQLQFLDEQPFTAHLGQRRIQDHIAACHHGHQLNLEIGVAGFEALLYIMCLPECERTLACGNS